MFLKFSSIFFLAGHFNPLIFSFHPNIFASLSQNQSTHGAFFFYLKFVIFLDCIQLSDCSFVPEFAKNWGLFISSLFYCNF